MVLVAEIGSEIVKNELIAETKGLFGFFKSSVNSPVSGTIESISDLTGQVVIREAPLPVEVDAYIEGVIDEVIENKDRSDIDNSTKGQLDFIEKFRQ